MSSDRLPSSSIMRALRTMMEDISPMARGAYHGAGEMLDMSGGRAATLMGGGAGAAAGALNGGANGNWVDDPNIEAGQGAMMGGVGGAAAGATLAALAGAGRGAMSARAVRQALRQALESSGEMAPRMGVRPMGNRMEMISRLRELENAREQIGTPPPPEAQDQAAQLDMMIMSLRQQLRGA